MYLLLSQRGPVKMTVYTLCNRRAGFRWGRDWKAQPSLPLPAAEERRGRWDGRGRDDWNLGDWLGCQTKLSSSWYSRLHECNSCVLHLSHTGTLRTACPLPALLPALSGGQQGQASAPLSSNLHRCSVLLDLRNEPQILLHRTTPNRTAPLKERGHSPACRGQFGAGVQQGQDEWLARVAPQELWGNLLSCAYHQGGRQGDRRWILSHMAFRLICTVCCEHDRNGSFSINIPTSSPFMEEATYMIPVRSDDMAVFLIRYILKFRALSHKYLCICIA